MTDQKIEKDFEEKIKKITDRKDRLELEILLEILKSLDKEYKGKGQSKETRPELKF